MHGSFNAVDTILANSNVTTPPQVVQMDNQIVNPSNNEGKHYLNPLELYAKMLQLNNTKQPTTGAQLNSYAFSPSFVGNAQGNLSAGGMMSGGPGFLSSYSSIDLAHLNYNSIKSLQSKVKLETPNEFRIPGGVYPFPIYGEAQLGQLPQGNTYMHNISAEITRAHADPRNMQKNITHMEKFNSALNGKCSTLISQESYKQGTHTTAKLTEQPPKQSYISDQCSIQSIHLKRKAIDMGSQLGTNSKDIPMSSTKKSKTDDSNVSYETREKLLLNVFNQGSSRRVRKRASKQSKYRGVCWNKTNSSWKASLKVNGKNLHIGYFDDELDAAKAYDVKAKFLKGDKAKLNFP